MSHNNENYYYLGLDLSTQQLKCTAMNDTHDIVLEEAVNFDRDLPEFNTTHGAIHNGDTVTSPTIMWVKAMDILFDRLKKSPVAGKIRGISGAGQQHGSVYWSKSGIEKLSKLDSQKTLQEQLSEAFEIDQSPIWQDASTTRECRSLEGLVGGAQALADLTGSKAYERFTGNQIAKIHNDRREAYDATQNISLVSSFLTSLLLGKLAPVDSPEGSGTNLMNIKSHRWEDKLLTHCGGSSLREKLALEPVEGGNALGKISPYYVERFGLHPDCAIMPFTGDNSATLVSMNLHEGDCVVSLGTSDTVLVYLKQGAAKATTESHLMAHPTDPTGFMGMLCYKNGSLTRQHIRDVYASGDWDEFNKLLQTDDTQNKTGFYYHMQEIIPFAKGIYRFENGQQVQEFDTPAANVRAIVESQFLSMRIRLQRMTTVESKRILATGGAAANTALLQVLSNIMGLPVYKQKGMNSASLGGALLAKYGTVEDGVGFEDMMKRQGTAEEPELVCKPDLRLTKQYAARVDEYVRLEKSVVDQQ
ncbi:hypothetical protein BDB00DRAFT_790875 [Zychaea mexicana]|uniref:uncharacterized protein n=1 Tax=Zychaea mexicana TaxID=64656 RepID=UPI0022FE9CC8|nr:uncharacterized protein BDB00DRAFT_790875 [Zychaea mexicana]KAI9489670.1 hypothetical protein BDB00DRAFT_790875 [Zychaea mexicana]